VIYALGEQAPDIHPDAFVHPDAIVIGSVVLDAGASVWPAAVLRGDYGRIEIGARTSIQDGTVVHTTEQWPTLIGSGCVVGHNVHVEGCTIGDGCLIGSGSVVLNRAVVEPGAAVGAAALVPEGRGGAERADRARRPGAAAPCACRARDVGGRSSRDLPCRRGPLPHRSASDRMTMTGALRCLASDR